jgi:hypothetical protein
MVTDAREPAAGALSHTDLPGLTLSPVAAIADSGVGAARAVADPFISAIAAEVLTTARSSLHFCNALCCAVFSVGSTSGIHRLLANSLGSETSRTKNNKNKTAHRLLREKQKVKSSVTTYYALAAF